MRQLFDDDLEDGEIIDIVDFTVMYETGTVDDEDGYVCKVIDGRFLVPEEPLSPTDLFSYPLSEDVTHVLLYRN